MQPMKLGIVNKVYKLLRIGVPVLMTVAVTGSNVQMEENEKEI